jgi:hypothetical protein
MTNPGHLTFAHGWTSFVLMMMKMAYEILSTTVPVTNGSSLYGI